MTMSNDEMNRAFLIRRIFNCRTTEQLADFWTCIAFRWQDDPHIKVAKEKRKSELKK